MPNWCYNRATFTHEDPNEITRLINAAKAGKLFNEFLPMPPELLEEAPIGDDYQERSAAIAKRNEEQFGYTSWYDWSIAHWGTKWDISEIDEDEMQKSSDGKSVSFSFDTAWAPPTEWYDNIDGFHITAYYHEPGVGFAGKWTSEDGDDQYEIDMMEDIEGVKERIPSDILDEFGIIDDMKYYQEENAEEEDDGGEEWWSADEALEGIDVGEVTIEFGNSEDEEVEEDDELSVEERLDKIAAEFDEVMARDEKGKNK